MPFDNVTRWIPTEPASSSQPSASASRTRCPGSGTRTTASCRARRTPRASRPISTRTSSTPGEPRTCARTWPRSTAQRRAWPLARTACRSRAASRSRTSASRRSPRPSERPKKKPASALRGQDPSMSENAGAALASAEAQVAAVRDDPAARLALIARTYHGPTGHAPQHLPFRRAALSFMRWQASRGVLDPLDASPPGSVWWRAVNERLLRDGCEAVALVGGLDGEPSSKSVRFWLDFVARPTGRNWYRAHNASIVDAYLEHRSLAEAESRPERFFMNVALVRVLYAHALVGAPQLALGN